MSDKEKLIEMLHNGVRCPGTVTDCHDCPFSSQEVPCDEYAATADMLIAKGVVIPVRCKDCVHWYEPDETCLKIYSDGAVSPYAWQYRKPDDFCSYGEREVNGRKKQ